MSSGFWQYLGSFMFYTLAVIGLLYGVFWYLRKNGNLGLAGLPGGKKPIQSQQDAPLVVESRLPLEVRKNLYIVRAGQERFLISTSMENTQCLARLENASATEKSPEPAGESSAPAAPPPDALSMSSLRQLCARLNPVAR